MLPSRGLSLIKASYFLKQCSTSGQVKQTIRNGHVWAYRTGGPKPPKRDLWLAEGIMGFAWWWVLWHLATEPEHISGEFPYPDASKWTDEELGIPPLDE